MHQSKGLEYPAVCIACCDSGKFPDPKASDIEEERRLFYVALTRAETELTITCTEGMESSFFRRASD